VIASTAERKIIGSSLVKLQSEMLFEKGPPSKIVKSSARRHNSEVNRREFLVAGASAAALAGSAIQFAAAQTLARMPDAKRKTVIKPKYWAWVGINKNASSSDLKAMYAKYHQHGIEAIFLEGGIDEREFDIIREAGLELHSWMWTTNRGDAWIGEHHPDWYMVSRTGKSCHDHPPYVGYYKWISPVIPGVQNYLKERAEELASHPAISGVHLDYVRYPDVILPKGLWRKYGLDQTNEMPEYDFCYSEHTRRAFEAFCGRDPLEIKGPAHDQQWLHFRYDSVTQLVKQLADVVHRHHKPITAAVFPTPRMARKICRQDWDKWPLDAVCPMTYNSFYDEGVDWIGDCILENIHAVTFPVFAGLYMPDIGDDAAFKHTLELVHRQGGAGVSLFGGVSDAQWKVFENTIQGIKKE